MKYDVVDIIEQQAKLTAYYNGQGSADKESYNHPGHPMWWDYLVNDARKFLLEVKGTKLCCNRCTNVRT